MVRETRPQRRQWRTLSVQPAQATQMPEPVPASQGMPQPVPHRPTKKIRLAGSRRQTSEASQKTEPGASQKNKNCKKATDAESSLVLEPQQCSTEWPDALPAAAGQHGCVLLEATGRPRIIELFAGTCRLSRSLASASNVAGAREGVGVECWEITRDPAEDVMQEARMGFTGQCSTPSSENPFVHVALIAHAEIHSPIAGQPDMHHGTPLEQADRWLVAGNPLLHMEQSKDSHKSQRVAAGGLRFKN